MFPGKQITPNWEPLLQTLQEQLEEHQNGKSGLVTEDDHQDNKCISSGTSSKKPKPKGATSLLEREGLWELFSHNQKGLQSWS